MTDFQQCWSDYQARVQFQLNKQLPLSSDQPFRLHQAMRYACLDGGKRLRAMLVYCCGELFGTIPERLDIPACAVECMHAYSLIHDDMPAMDDDSLRRGKPAVHIAFDEGTALLAGDALQAFAIEILSNNNSLKVLKIETRLQLISILSKASGANGMAGGQGIDLDSVGKQLTLSELETMHKKKTGALIRAAAQMGAICSESVSDSKMVSLSHFADQLGLLFQITDDILDEISTNQTLGKTAGKDMADNKPTYIKLLGIEASLKQAKRHHDRALSYLEEIDENTEFLVQLNEFVLNRAF